MYRVSEDEFHEMMEKALEVIPESFKEKMENIVFISEPYPSNSDMERLGLKSKYSLLGLYSGVPYTNRSTWYSNVTPDRILLYQRNIETYAYTKDELMEKIKEVIIHEVAHYFGMDEDEVRNAGY